MTRNPLRRTRLAAVASAGFVAIAIASASPVLAHAMLERASPPVGATLPGPPTELRLAFSEPVEPTFCRVTLQNGLGENVAVGELRSAGNGRVLSLALPNLPPGTYTVAWRVTSVDTHRTEGRFQFNVAH